MFQLQLNRPLFMRFYIIYKYVSIINIEFAISIMSTPTKLIVDNPKLVFFGFRQMFIYLIHVLYLFYIKLSSESETIFTNDEHKILSIGFH